MIYSTSEHVDLECDLIRQHEKSGEQEIRWHIDDNKLFIVNRFGVKVIHNKNKKH